MKSWQYWMPETSAGAITWLALFIPLLLCATYDELRPAFLGGNDSLAGFLAATAAIGALFLVSMAVDRYARGRGLEPQPTGRPR